MFDVKELFRFEHICIAQNGKYLTVLDQMNVPLCQETNQPQTPYKGLDPDAAVKGPHLAIAFDAHVLRLCTGQEKHFDAVVFLHRHLTACWMNDVIIQTAR